MKILFFTPYFYPYISGIAVYSKLLLKELNKKHKIEVLTFKHDVNLLSEESIDGLKVFRMPYIFKLSKGFISPQSFIIFIKKIIKKNLLIVNLPSVEALFLVVLAKLLNVKVLAIFYCHINLGPGFIRQSLSFFVNLLVKLQLYCSDGYVTFSADYIESLNWPKKLTNKAIYIKPIVNQVKENTQLLNKFKSKKKNQYWLGFVGRISREKGLDYLIDAIGRLPDSNKYTLVLVGPKGSQVAGESQYYNDLLIKIKKSKINCLFLGILSDQELFSFYRSIDLLILPSINSTEAYGLVQLEAMSVGTPVVASDLPGLREPIQELGMGLLVPKENVEELSAAIVKIMSSKNKYKLPVMQKKFNSFFSKKRCIEEYEEIIKTIIK